MILTSFRDRTARNRGAPENINIVLHLRLKQAGREGHGPDTNDKQLFVLSVCVSEKVAMCREINYGTDRQLGKRIRPKCFV